MKDTIFISHATPSDNLFATWLATKLELCGYKVWVDVKNLGPSVDFWDTINRTIREEAVKFIFVASKASVDESRDGVKKELAVADKVRRENENFIVPVRIDDVSFADLPVEIIRLNAIDFYNNWAKGLEQLLEYLSKENVTKGNVTNESDFYVERWTDSQSQNRSQLTDDLEKYCSNLYEIELPSKTYLYNTEDVADLFKEKHIPHKQIKTVTVSFCCNKCVETWLGKNVEFSFVKTQNAIREYTKPESFMGQEFSNLSRDIISLINWSICELFYSKELRKYKPSFKKSKNVYYFKPGTKYKKPGEKRPKSLSGIYKKTKLWHFGLSGYFVQNPCEGVIINWHLVFSDPTTSKLLPDSSQISARRSKGKLFFNNQWRDLLDTAMSFLSCGSDYACYTSCCEENALYLSTKSITFHAQKSYVEPYNYKEMREDGPDEQPT